MMGSVGSGLIMMKGRAKTSWKVRASAERRRGYKVCCFFRIVTKSSEQIAAFDGVRGVLGQIEQFGKFRPVGAAGEEGVDKRGRDYKALPFPEGFVMRGLLFCEVGVALFESGEENGVFLAEGLSLGLRGRKLFVPPVQRLIAELVGLVFPFKRRGLKLVASGVVMS